MAFGVFLVSLLYLVSFVAKGGLLWPINSSETGFFLVVLSLLLVLVHGQLSFWVNDEFDFGRFWQSYILFIIFVVGAFSMAKLAQLLPEAYADFAVRFVFFALVLTGLAGVFGYSPFSGVDARKSVLFFSEPSHFALSFSPFLFYMIILSSSRMKLLYILSSFVMALALENLTLVIAVSLIGFVALPLRRLMFFATIAAILLISTGPDYYASRVFLTRESQNLSSLVYMQGWERAYLNLKDSMGVGVGFQQFGIIGRRGEIQENLSELAGGDLNLLDGGSVASKFIGEFGVLGIVTLLVYLVFLAKKIKILHVIAMGKGSPKDCTEAFFLACFVMYCIDLFVRGTGFFSPTGFLFLVSILWMSFVEPKAVASLWNKQSAGVGNVHSLTG